MGFQRHQTEEEKRIRKMKYNALVFAGIEPRRARIFRDWTMKKVLLIIKKEANPIR